MPLSYHLSRHDFLPVFPSLSSYRHSWKPHHAWSPKVRTRSLQCTGWAPGNTTLIKQSSSYSSYSISLLLVWYVIFLGTCFFVVGFDYIILVILVLLVWLVFSSIRDRLGSVWCSVIVRLQSLISRHWTKFHGSVAQWCSKSYGIFWKPWGFTLVTWKSFNIIYDDICWYIRIFI